HRVHAVAPARAHVAVAAQELAVVGQHEGVSAADSGLPVSQARRNARAQHGHQGHVLVGGVVLARQYLRRLDLEMRVEVAIGLVVAYGLVVALHRASSYTVCPRSLNTRPWSSRLSACPAKKSPPG